jgi:hypothetical protein
MWTEAIESKQMKRLFHRGPWLSIWSLFLGLVISAAIVIGGNLTSGLITLAAFVIFAAFFYFGARNETVQGIGSPARDERWETINQRALAFAGAVVTLILIVGWIVDVLQGQDGSPYAEIVGGAAVAYLAAALWLRSRI